MTKKRFGFLDYLIWYGTFLIILIAIIDKVFYSLQESWIGGDWFFLAVICSLASILYFLRRFNG